MGGFNEFTVLKDAIEQDDSLHIVQLKVGKKIQGAHLRGYLNVYRYRDKDTRQIVAYIPSLEISGYGADENKANKMLIFSLDEYFYYLCSLPTKNFQAEIAHLKWKQNPLKHKDYSNPPENVKGQLEALNAEGNKIERLTLQAK